MPDEIKKIEEAGDAKKGFAAPDLPAKPALGPQSPQQPATTSPDKTPTAPAPNQEPSKKSD